MIARAIVCFGIALALTPAIAAAQYTPPVPLYPGTPPRTYEQQPLPPATAPPPDASTARPPEARAPLALPPSDSSQRPPPAMGAAPPPLPRPAAEVPAADRVFCAQPLSVRIVDRDTVAERFRPFIGIWSDASWTPQLCAALIVENVAADGTASIVYAFGPMASGARASAGGVLRGTGIIRDGELRFQNSDGSQYAFRPLYSDLDGKYTTPQGQTYGAVFKRTM